MEDTNELTKSQEQINKEDLENKAAIMGQIKAALAESKDEICTGITFHFADRTINFRPYADRKTLKETHAPVINKIIDDLSTLLDAEAEIHAAAAAKITIPTK